MEAINSPVIPERKKSGTNTAMVVMVPAVSGHAYSSSVLYAASVALPSMR